LIADSSIVHQWFADNYTRLQSLSISLVRSRSNTNNPVIEAQDILSEVILPILEKPKPLHIVMIKQNQMMGYLNRAIDINIFSKLSPTQWKKRMTVPLEYNENDPINNITETVEDEYDFTDDVIIDRIYQILGCPTEMSKVFGKNWRYFGDLIEYRYIKNLSARKISADLQIPYHQTVSHLLYCRSRLYTVLHQEKIVPKNYKLNYKLRCSLSRYSEQ